MRGNLEEYFAKKRLLTSNSVKCFLKPSCAGYFFDKYSVKSAFYTLTVLTTHGNSLCHILFCSRAGGYRLYYRYLPLLALAAPRHQTPAIIHLKIHCQVALLAFRYLVAARWFRHLA